MDSHKCASESHFFPSCFSFFNLSKKKAATDCITLLKGFVTEIRKIECFRNSWILFCPERNLGHEGGYLAQPFSELHPKNKPLAQYEEKDYGWWTDNAAKINYAYKTREIMATGGVRYMKNWVCTNPWLPPEDRRKITKTKFEEQMRRFRPVTTSVKDPHNIPRMTVSGKVDKDGKISGSFQDDLMMAFCMSIYLWHLIIMRQVLYLNYATIFPQGILG